MHHNKGHRGTNEKTCTGTWFFPVYIQTVSTTKTHTTQSALYAQLKEVNHVIQQQALRQNETAALHTPNSARE